MENNVDKKSLGDVLPRLLAYSAASFAGLVLSRTLASPLLTFITILICVSFIAMLVCRVGRIAFIPALLELVFITVAGGAYEAFSILPYIILAFALGYGLKRALRPSDTVVIASSLFIGVGAIIIPIVNYIDSGVFSITDIFMSLSLEIDEAINTIANDLSATLGMEIIDVTQAASTVKAIAPGTYIAMQTLAVCIAYYFTVLLAKLIRDKHVYTDVDILDIKPHKISSFIFIICMLFSPVSHTSTSNIRFYTFLTTNIVLILMPIFVFTGIYYVLTIKFRKNHENPIFFTAVLILTFVFKLYPLLILYFTFNGHTYTLAHDLQKPRVL